MAITGENNSQKNNRTTNAIDYIKQETRDSFYQQNEDFSGSRTIEENKEIVSYKKDSTIRIWFNDLTTEYDNHIHNAMEIIMPIDNWYDAYSPNGYYHVQPGEILIIPPNELHRLVAPETGSRFIFLIDVSFMFGLQGFTGISPLIKDYLHITPEAYGPIYNELYQLLVQIRTEYFSSSHYYELTIHSHLLNFFVLLGQDHLNKVDMYSGLNSLMQKEYMQRFNNVLNYINEHFAEDLTLEEVADCSGFSKFHFTRLFKKYTDTTFYEYLVYRRIQEAERLLADADMTITDVALYSGFSSISTFNRTFKQKKNCTPREYRTMCRNNLQYKAGF